MSHVTAGEGGVKSWNDLVSRDYPDMTRGSWKVATPDEKKEEDAEARRMRL